MAKYDELMDQYLEECGIDSPQTLARTLTAVRKVAATQKKRQQWLKMTGVGGSTLSAALLMLAWWLWEYSKFVYEGGIRSLGFSQGPKHAEFLFCLCGGILAAAIALAVWLTLLVKHWHRARRLARMDTSLPNPGQVLK